ncbi:hypothetical protein [uncultured Selenomonas sp.]|uniref:hypothetical protein n=1 Tax=uncultured Selenomonas sp. TaxID=159275 RepID=UPI0025F90EC1|nr:hypothetical protein [uncultured Selenomonas sp.]
MKTESNSGPAAGDEPAAGPRFAGGAVAKEDGVRYNETKGRDGAMRHYYSTIQGIVTTFSDIYASPEKGESIIVHMERPSEQGFDVVEFLLPSFTCQKCIGFSEDERISLEKFIRNNSALIWEIAKEDGEIIADVG